MIITFGAKSDLGKARKNNEDNCAVNEKINLFIVADGMGGHSSGEVASKIAVELISTNMQQLLEKQNDSAAKNLTTSIKLANQAIYEASQKYPQNKGMGTTVVAAHSSNKIHTVAWVGDSRVYLVRHNGIQQLTVDHSLVQEQVNKGLITPDQAEKSELKNILTRALGTSESVIPDVVEIPVFDNDYLILCSDGLTRMLTDEQILKTVQEYKEPEKICSQLIQLANEAGGKDNITAVITNTREESLWGKFIKTLGAAS